MSTDETTAPATEEAPAIPTDKLVKAYIKMRDARSTLKQQFEAEDAKIQEHMNVISRHLLSVCKQAGADSIKTQHGTIIRGTQTRYWTTDWESMYTFIKENDALELLERRVAQRNMADFLKNNPDNIPKGLNANSEYTITIRRS